jgi:hypothetical protein
MAVEAVEATEVAEATEVTEAAEVFKAWKITMEEFKAILVLEFNNLRTKIISFWRFEQIIFWQNYEKSRWIFWRGLLRLAYVNFLKTGWWNSNFKISRIYTCLQTKSDLHIFICQSQFKRNISMWDTLYYTIVRELFICLWLIGNFKLNFLKTDWWNSNFQTSRIYSYLQTKSNLHISICQSEFKRNISMRDTLYPIPMSPRKRSIKMIPKHWPIDINQWTNF